MLITLHLNKFKLTKFGCEAEYVEKEEVDGDQSAGAVSLSIEIVKKYPFQPKDELLDAFHQLVPHLMMLCEVIDEDTVLAPAALFELKQTERYRVTGLVVKETGVTLIGRRTRRGKKVLNLTTPFLLWDDEQDPNPYRFRHHLREAVDEAENACLAYIGGDYLKQAAHDTQLDIQFNEPQTTES